MKEAGALGRVLEGAVAAVVQERHGVVAEVAPPAAAQDEEVRVAVVVEVGEDEVQAAELAGEAGAGGPVGKGTVAIVVEEVHGVERAGGGGHDVEEAVAVEVFDRGTAGVGGEVDAGVRGVVEELAEVGIGTEAGLGDEPLRGDRVRVASELHVGKV